MGTWKKVTLREMWPMEAWLVRFKREEKTVLGAGCVTFYIENMCELVLSD